MRVERNPAIEYLDKVLEAQEKKQGEERSDAEVLYKAAIGLGVGLTLMVVLRGFDGILKLMQNEAQDSKKSPLF